MIHTLTHGIAPSASFSTRAYVLVHPLSLSLVWLAQHSDTSKVSSARFGFDEVMIAAPLLLTHETLPTVLRKLEATVGGSVRTCPRPSLLRS
jgi:hypothetical protein